MHVMARAAAHGTSGGLSESGSRSNRVSVAPAGMELGIESEVELITRWQAHGDVDALRTLVVTYKRRVEAIAHRYKRYPVEWEDLIGEGYVGLLVAINRFDTARQGVRLMTYASFWIRAYMARYIAASWGGGKTGVGITRAKTLFKLRRESSRLAYQQVLDEVAHESCCESFRLSPKSLRSLLDVMSLQEFSLDAGVGEVLPSADDPASEVECAQVHEFCSRAVRAVLGVLNERELLVVSERYLNEDSATLASLGARLGVTRERVRQIEQSALRKLQAAVGRSGLSLEAFREAVL